MGDGRSGAGAGCEWEVQRRGVCCASLCGVFQGPPPPQGAGCYVRSAKSRTCARLCMRTSSMEPPSLPTHQGLRMTLQPDTVHGS